MSTLRAMIAAPATEPESIDAAAERWWLRLHAGADATAARAEFQRWYDADPAHRAAYDGLAEVYDLLGEAPSAASAPRRRWPVFAAAAVLALAAVLSALPDWRADHTTAVGEQRRLTLADGSRVTLDADSALAVDYSSEARRVILLRGRAFFEVEHDLVRPFLVAAEDGESRALGTAFAVARSGDVTRVTVTESRVEVTAAGNAVTLVAGEQAAYSDAGLSTPAAVDLDQAAGWRQGHLVFQDQPLADVVDALAPYHRGGLLVMGDNTRALRVSGVFSLDRPAAILGAIEASLGLKVYRMPLLTVIVAG